MYSVLVIEDHHETGTLLRTFVDNELHRLVTVPPPGEPPRNPKTGDLFEDAFAEPGQGQLVHLRHLIDHLEMMKRDPESEIGDIFPTARLFPLDALSELIQVAERFNPEYGHLREEDNDACGNLREIIERFCKPDIIIVDLAMCNEEIERMKIVGYSTFNETEPQGLADPRDALRTLTGFKVLRAYAHRVPVIVTSFYPNPLVAQHCLVNGAFAYVRKPVLSKAHNRHDFFHAAETGTTVQDLAAKTNKNPLDVVVVHYLTDAASEVLKAMSARWISGLW